ncbi:hypothetical protein LSAT2_029160 [Lamellibrachia satsuma]|nr:hypothetical protein LSAT2_029160 [Lamellibrachia satsuma]
MLHTSRGTHQVAYVIVKAANTPRPGNWILERSLDSVTYKPWQYYAISDSECMRLYGVPPTRGIPHYKQDDEVICTSRYSKLNPLENGEIHTSIVNGRPGIDGPSETLLPIPLYVPTAQPIPLYGPTAQPIPLYGPTAQPIPLYVPTAQPIPLYVPTAQPIPLYVPTTQPIPLYVPTAQPIPLYVPTAQPIPLCSHYSAYS